MIPEHIAGALARVAPQLGSFVRGVHYHAELGSTHDEAARLLARHLPDNGRLFAEWSHVDAVFKRASERPLGKKCFRYKKPGSSSRSCAKPTPRACIVSVSPKTP